MASVVAVFACAGLTPDEHDDRMFLRTQAGQLAGNDQLPEDLGMHPIRQPVSLQILDLGHSSPLASSRSR